LSPCCLNSSDLIYPSLDKIEEHSFQSFFWETD
jgi:hypothetical protein